MKKRTDQFDAKYECYDEGKHWFKCLKCANDLLYEPWEIVKHLRASHRIPRKRQAICPWKREYEENYQENKNKTLKYEMDASIGVDETPQEEYEKEKRRRKKEMELLHHT